jgi:hypothetical protein
MSDDEDQDDRKRQAKRNKQKQQEQQAKAMLTRDADDLQREIRKLEREATQSRAIVTHIAQLKEALDAQLKAKEAAYAARLAKHKKQLEKKGLKPTDSPYYDEKSNPWGLPPTKEEEAAQLRQQRLKATASKKPPRPPGPPPPKPAFVFIPPLPPGPWPAGALVVPHPRQDLIDKDAVDRQVRDSERAVRQAERNERLAAANPAAVAGAGAAGVAVSAKEAKYEAMRREQHAAIHEPVPAAADVVIDPAALRIVPKAVRLKRDTAPSSGEPAAVPAAKRARPVHEGATPSQAIDTALASFMQEIDDLNG